MKKTIASFALLGFACVNDLPTEDPAQASGLPSSNFTEYWEELKDPNVVYFAGSNFEWRLSRDSIEIVQHEFTDAIACTQDQSGILKCSPSSWSHHFLGTYQRHDSTLAVQIGYHHSEPENAPNLSLSESQAVFRIQYSVDSSEMTVAKISGTGLFNTGSAWRFGKLEHKATAIVSAEVSDDCGPADGPETRMTFKTAACPQCNPDLAESYSFYLGYEDVDQIQAGDILNANTNLCGDQGCVDAAWAKVEFFRVTADSVSGRITLRNGMKRTMGLFTAPKKRQRPMCG